MADIITFPSTHRITTGSEPHTITIHVYGRRAYRTVAALERVEGVSVQASESVEIPRTATDLWRVWPNGPITWTCIRALATAGSNETVVRIPIVE
jgi:hypothetical protein